MNLLNKVIRPFALLRHKQIRKYATNSQEIQNEQYARLLSLAKNTEIGRTYCFKELSSYETFKNRIPIHSYDDLKPFIKRMIDGEEDVLWRGRTSWFAKSSGTTSEKSKFLPVTDDVLRHCHYQGARDSLLLYTFADEQSSNLLAKKSFVLGGSHSPFNLNNNAKAGDLSAILLQNAPFYTEYIRVPSKDIILIDEWNRKLERVVEEIYNKDIVSLSGVPSWMLLVLKAVLEKTGKASLLEVWPNLEVFFHGGVSFLPYRGQYEKLIPSEAMNYRDIYNASEGFFGIQDQKKDNAMLLMLDYGTFYEFIPTEEGLISDGEKAIPLEDVELNKNYAMLITTLGGLWRYLIGDTVRFVSKSPYRFIITGRTKHYINAFGEELMVDNAVKALRKTCLETYAEIKEYTAAPRFLLETAQGYHEWLIEFDRKPESLDVFAQMLDSNLQQINSDYEAKRYSSLSLQPLKVIEAKQGVFHKWLDSKGKLGGQHKVPNLCNNAKILDEILSINN